MSGAPTSSLSPATLPVGTLVGRWRVVDWAGRGSHGSVYRAVPADKEFATPVALKLALVPRYRAGPADELYALGVTACRWLTGEYPRFSEPERDAQGLWRMETVEVPQALEQVPPASVAVRAAEPPPPAASPKAKPRARVWPWLAAASALVVAAWVGGRVVGTLRESFSVRSSGADRADAGTTGLGETVSATSSTLDAPESSLPVTGDEPLPEPQTGQLRPDAKGRCPHRGQVVLNGVCWWVPLAPDPEACEASGGALFQGRCYVPAVPRKRPSTAQPPLEP